MEEWKQIWESNYWISSYWNIKSVILWVDRILKQRMTHKWYLQIHFLIWWKHSYPYVHRLVWLFFVDNPHWYNEINHIDWNKLNNHKDNVEWCTRSYNNKHAFLLWLNSSPMKWKFWKNNPLSKKVYQYKDWVLIKEFDSLTVCANELWFDLSDLSKIVRWIRKHKHFTFTY